MFLNSISSLPFQLRELFSTSYFFYKRISATDTMFRHIKDDEEYSRYKVAF